MRYLVIGNVAILASRGIEHISGEQVTVDVVGVPDGAALHIQHGTMLGNSYSVTSERTQIPASDLTAAGGYSVTVLWKETDPETEETTQHEARGNAFQILQNQNGRSILPAPLSSATEREQMWSGIVQALEVILPLIDTIKNGNDVV